MKTDVKRISLISMAGLLGLGLLAGCGTSSAGSAEILNPDYAQPRTMPVDEFFAFSWMGQSHADLVQMGSEFNLRVGELVAECMLEQGFEYHPDQHISGFNFGHFGPGGGTTEPLNREWVAQYGFGFESGDNDLFTRVQVVEPWERGGELSEAERAAFMFAYEGRFVPFDELEGWTQEEISSWFQNRGCVGPAEEQAQSESFLFAERVYDEFDGLFRAYTMTHAEVELHPDNAALNSEWSSCMADAGFPNHSNRLGLWNSFFNEWQNTRFIWVAGEAVENPEFAADPALATELRNREVEIALADFDCWVSVDGQVRLDNITYEVQSRFVDSHRDLLELFRQVSSEMFAEHERRFDRQ
ncbi:MAG: hypothetical protein FWG25_07450 [Promicromonosporaceae bacterium]|nr:hypothetical protein [Promicromonosporaceae bacterium]